MTFSDNKIVLKRCGNNDITFTDYITSFGFTLRIKTHNILSIEDDPIYVVGSGLVSFNKEDNTINFYNRSTIKVKVKFNSNSTFRKVKFDDFDNSIIKVNEKGEISSTKIGSINIILRFNDNYSIDEQIQLRVNVVKQNPITNISQFFKLVRKGLGHFGAFLVLALFSTCFYILRYQGNIKKLSISLSCSVFIGFFIATLTEFIQIFVPGIYGTRNDVLIDFLGFMCGFIMILTIFLVNVLIKKSKDKKKTSN